MQSSLNCTLRGNYELKLIDSRTGVVKQSGKFHNTPCFNLPGMLANTNTNIGTYIRAGSGTEQPKYSEEKLQHALWSIVHRKQVLSNTLSKDQLSRTFVCVYEFPATTEYVGTVTELAIYGSYWNDSYYMLTHSLLTDAEGQQITFVKTDLDVLQVSVTFTVTLSATGQNFTLFKNPFALSALCNVLDEPYRPYFPNAKIGHLYYLQYYTDMKYGPYIPQGTQIESYWSFPKQFEWYRKPHTAVVNSTEVSLSLSRQRMETTEVTSERFFIGTCISGIGYHKLPNESILPAFPIKNIPVGTGDGATTEFEYPIGYFKKDTEVIYVDGVSLQRGIDYTANNLNNHKGLPELAQFLGRPKVFSPFKNFYPRANEDLLVPFINTSGTTRRLGTLPNEAECFMFGPEDPLYVEYPTEVTLNRLATNRLIWRNDSGSGYWAYNEGGTLLIDTSPDGIEYTNIASCALKRAEEKYTLHTFPDTTSKYWRIRCTRPSSFQSAASLSVYVSGNTRNGDTFNLDQMGVCSLLYVEPTIKLKNPPAIGAKITMDVDMDILFKNDKFVIDYETRFDVAVSS